MELALRGAEALGRADGPQGRKRRPNSRGRNPLHRVLEPQRIEYASRLHIVAGLAVADDPAAPAGYGLERFRHLLSLDFGFLSCLRNNVAPIYSWVRLDYHARGVLAPCAPASMLPIGASSRSCSPTDASATSTSHARSASRRRRA